MPGDRITDRQVTRYMTLRRTHTQEAAAAKAGISVRSARRIEADPVLPSQKPRRRWRSRSRSARRRLGERGRAAPGRHTRAAGHHGAAASCRTSIPAASTACCAPCSGGSGSGGRCPGPPREVFFPQAHAPGRLGLSDFTDAGGLGVTIAGVPLAHRLYHFALAFSGWEHAEVVEGGESFVALAHGLQNALWQAGGVPAEHRTDSLSAAFKNLPGRGRLHRPLRRAAAATTA